MVPRDVDLGRFITQLPGHPRTGDDYRRTVFFYFGKGTWEPNATPAELADPYARSARRDKVRQFRINECAIVGRPMITNAATKQPARHRRLGPMIVRTDDNYIDLSAAFLTAYLGWKESFSEACMITCSCQIIYIHCRFE